MDISITCENIQTACAKIDEAIQRKESECSRISNNLYQSEEIMRECPSGAGTEDLATLMMSQRRWAKWTSLKNEIATLKMQKSLAGLILSQKS